jgi:hypothetical protein
MRHRRCRFKADLHHRRRLENESAVSVQNYHGMFLFECDQLALRERGFALDV